jgi:hypothetical protein
VSAAEEAAQIAVLVLVPAFYLVALLVVWRDDHQWRDRRRL